MAKKNIVYHEKVNGEETLIYSIQDENTGRNKYFILEGVPENLSNEKALARINAEIEKYNAEKNKHARLLSLTTKNGEKRWFVEEPSSLMGALLRAHQVDRAIKKEEKLIEEINKPVQTGLVNGSGKYKKASGKVKAKALAIGLAATIAIGSLVGFTNLGNKDNNYNSQIGNDTTISQQVTDTTFGDFTTGFETPITPIAPDTTVSPEVEETLKHTDLSTLTYKTTQNSDGSKVLELADALKIADACYDNLQYELENSEHDYSFDASKFNPEMYVGEAISENSLKVIENYVNQYGCRGMLMIGADAMKEANEVSVNLTGEKIITDSKQLDDPVKAFMTCMYISVRNYEYCADIVGPENVTPEMVFDCYLYGCGNLRKWLREDVKNNTPYESKTYSKDILYYGECLEPYMEALKKGLTDGSHDKFWQDTYYNGLWKKPVWSKVQASSESGGIERE